MLPTILDIATLADGYRRGAFTPLDVAEAVIGRIAAWPDKAVWISRLPDETIRRALASLTSWALGCGRAGASPPITGSSRSDAGRGDTSPPTG